MLSCSYYKKLYYHKYNTKFRKPKGNQNTDFLGHGIKKNDFYPNMKSTSNIFFVIEFVTPPTGLPRFNATFKICVGHKDNHVGVKTSNFTSKGMGCKPDYAAKLCEIKECVASGSIRTKASCSKIDKIPVTTSRVA